ncbi:unnamed protein product [Rotaria sordida]|uniref:TELO2-interacting protein 2 n=1 Tax=Rotaria sordida TaxID=392033 RepID=A0A818M1Z9_9BILA|nr:unnamed protein product [Rotaria sordida]CAF3573921.1 unnamed protein product [Rotaria sordida]
MNNTISIFQNIDALITSKSLFNKSIETLGSITYPDQSIFIQLNDQLSELTVKDDELFTSKTDYLSSLLLFLFEHIPLEIDLNLLTSTQIDYHQVLSSTMKIYKPNLLPSNQNIIQYSSESQMILNHLYKFLQINNLEEFLLLKQHTQPIYLHCLHHLQPLLLKTTYDKYPIAIKLFVHIIKSMHQSSLSETFDLIFPVCLMTLDDPSIDMKLISLYLLDHLQRHCTSTELLLFNRANVIMYGLEQNLYHRGDRIILFECLLATTYRWLNILENEIYSGKHLFIRTSQLIERFIHDSLLETNIEYRRQLIKILQYYINRLELFAIRHLKHFIELIDDSIDNRLLRSDSLKLLLKIIEILKPRINVHRYDIMKIIIRCLFKIIHEDKENKTIMNLFKKCLKEFHLCTIEDNYVQDALRSLIVTSQLDLFYREHLQKLLETIEEN